jgi:hypothetical protein
METPAIVNARVTMLQKFLELPLKLKAELLFYPVFLLYRMPIAWFKSLWESRGLLDGRWSRYMGFHPHNSINSMYYRTLWTNINRYGRTQHSPIIGLGDYPLRNWFHLSLPASYIYANAGAVTTLLCTLIWVVSHLVWLEVVIPWWAISVTAVLLLSSTAYAMAFARQNYQMLGWMCLPFALFFTAESAYVLAAFAWFATGLSGITPVFFAVPIVAVLAIFPLDPWLPLVLLPALAHAAFRFLPLLISGGINRALISIAKLIGLSKRQVRYVRGMQRLGVVTLYFTALYLFSAALMSIALGEIAALPILGAMLFLINQRFFRVADEQSLIVISTSLFAFTAIQAEPNWLTMLAFWLAVNPIAFFLSIQRLSEDGGDGEILVNAPFDHTELENGVSAFLAAVDPGKRIYFAFEDPKGHYGNIFDGYRVIHELPLQVASKKEVHLFPDWWAVAETNYEGAPQCWGRALQEVEDNCQRWRADYAIIYQDSGSELAAGWTERFDLISEFDWGNYEHMLRGVRLWARDKPTPKWFLLQPKQIVAAAQA